MAHKVINKNSLVKYAVPGGYVIGTVISVDDDNVSIELPTGGNVSCAVNELVEINQDEFKNALVELIQVLAKKVDVNIMDETMSKELEQIKAELAKAKENITALESKNKELTDALATSNSEVTKLKSDAENVKKEFDSTKAELDKIRREQRADSRLAEIKELGAVAAVGKDETEAREKLADMDDAIYASTVEMAKAFKKLTDQTVTNFPKLTDQTITNDPKLTDQTVTANENADAVKDAAVDKKESADLANAATAAPTTSAFATAMKKLLNRSKDNDEE